MDPTQVVFLVGVVLFGLGLIVSTATFIIYVVRNKAHVESLDGKDRYRVHWYNTLWIYGVLMADCFFFFLLYLSQYFGQGILYGVIWERWIILAVIGLFNSYCLVDVMTTNSRDVASVMLVISYTAAYFVLWVATFSTVVQTQGLWFGASAFLFVCAMALYLFPFNKWSVGGSRYHEDIDGAPWGAHYHKVFYIILGVTYVAYFLIFLLSTTNGLTSVMSYEAEAASLMVFDVIWVGVFMLYMIVITSMHAVHALSIQDTTTGQTTYRASPPPTSLARLGKMKK